MLAGALAFSREHEREAAKVWDNLLLEVKARPDSDPAKSSALFATHPAVGERKEILKQIVALFEGMLTRDGSTFKLTKLEPAPFSSGKGFRFEYSLIRKADNVELSGTASAAVSRNELFAIVYQAPKLVFYPRHQERVTCMMQSARLQGV